jgi:predicted secreted protein
MSASTPDREPTRLPTWPLTLAGAGAAGLGAVISIIVLLSLLIVLAFAAMFTNLLGGSSPDTGTRRDLWEVTAVDSGSELNVDRGDRIEVRLESNPSTGYGWELDEFDGRVMSFDSSDYVAPDNAAVGQGGVEVLRFTAVDDGESTLKLKYWRAWEGDASVIETFEITVNVSD